MLAGQRVVQQLTTWLGSPNALWRRCTRAPRASVSRRRRRSLVTSCRVGKVTAAYPLQITLAQNRVGARLMEACGCGGRRRAEWRPVLHLRFNKLSLHVPYTPHGYAICHAIIVGIHNVPTEKTFCFSSVEEGERPLAAHTPRDFGGGSRPEAVRSVCAASGILNMS